VHTHRPEQCAGDAAPAAVSHDEQVRALRLFDQHGGRCTVCTRSAIPATDSPCSATTESTKPRVSCSTSLMICSSVGIAAL